MRKVVTRALSAALLVASVGCEPCAGVVDCVAEPRLQIGGRILDTGEGIAAPNVGIRLVTHAEGFSDSVTTTTTSDGSFLASIRVPVAGLYGYELVVSPPGLPGYRARGRSCIVQTTRGSGCDTGPLGNKPYFPYLLGIILRGPDSVSVSNFRFSFHRTAGSTLYGDSVIGGVVRRTGRAGRAHLLGLDIFATTVDSLVGDIIVHFTDTLTPRSDSSILRGVRLVPTIRFREDRIGLDLRAGPSLAYSFMITSGAEANPVSGVTVQFVRTSGVEAATDTSVAVSDASGRARINLRPLETGSVTGTLTVRPPSPWVAFSEVITLNTHDDDLSPVARSWNLGASPATRMTARRPR